MSKKSMQVKVVVSELLLFLIKKRAEKFGLTTSTYVKNLILSDIKEEKAPEKNDREIENLGRF